MNKLHTLNDFRLSNALVPSIWIIDKLVEKEVLNEIVLLLEHCPIGYKTFKSMYDQRLKIEITEDSIIFDNKKIINVLNIQAVINRIENLSNCL